MLKAPMDAQYAAYLDGLGASAAEVRCTENSDPQRTVTEDALVSPALLGGLRELADGRTCLMPLGISPAEEQLAKETGLPLAGTTAQVCKAVNGKIFSRRLVDALGLTAVPGQVCETVPARVADGAAARPGCCWRAPAWARTRPPSLWRRGGGWPSGPCCAT